MDGMPWRRRSRRRGAIRLAVAGVLVAAVGSLTAVGLWFRHTRTPEYALASLGQSLVARDSAGVRRHLDVTATSRQIVNSVIDVAAADAVESSEVEGNAGGFAMAGMALGLSMLDKMRPVMATRLARTINGALAGARDTSSIGRAPGAMFPLFDLSSGLAVRDTSSYRFRGVGTSRMQGDTAVIPVRYQDVELDTTLAVGVMMVRRAGTWTVVGIDQVGEHFSGVNAMRKARIERANAMVQSRLDSLLPVGTLSSEVTQAGYFDAYVLLSAPVVNRSADTLTSVLVRLRGGELNENTDNDFGLILGGGPVSPGASAKLAGTFKYNQFMDGHKTLRYVPESVQPHARFAVWHGANGRADTLMEVGTWREYLRYGPDRPRDPRKPR